MNKNQFERLKKQETKHAIIGAILLNTQPRTLLYGYSLSRHTHHVYLDEKSKIHLVVYTSQNEMIRHLTEDDVDQPSDLVPSKRLYPERCDFEFCQILQRNGVLLPFTSFNKDVKTTQFYGKRLEHLS